MAVRVQLDAGPSITPLYTLYTYTHISLASSAPQRRQDASPTGGEAPPTSAAPPANSPAPILISIISSPSNETLPPSSASPPSIITSNNTTLPSAPSRMSSALSLSVSTTRPSAVGTPGPAPNADVSATHGTFTLMDIVPAFAVVGAVLLGVLVWLAYGCCTRKPRFRDIDDDGELICGPPYVNERHYTYDDGEDIERAPRYEARSSTTAEKSYDYRWPSLDEHQQPVFRAVEREGGMKRDGDRDRGGERNAGFYVPPEYMAEDAPLISVALVAAPSSTSTKVTNVRRSVESSRVDSRAARYTSLSRSPSAAAMRESDSDGTDRDREGESWRDVRLDAAGGKEKQSEKEKVKQRLRERGKEKQKEAETALDAENSNNTTWLSSLRNTIAEGSLRLIHGGRAGTDRVDNAREPNPFAAAEVEPYAGKADSCNDNGSGIGASRSGTTTQASRRRGHSRTDSDVLLNPLPPTQTSGSGPGSGSAAGSLPMPMPEAIAAPQPAPEAYLPPVTPRGRRTYTRLRDEEEDKFTPRPARLSESRSPTRERSRGRGQSQSRSMSLRKKQSRRSGTPTNAVSNAMMSPRHILPQSPPRVTSPPLESAMCFTPILPLATSLGSPVARPAVRTRAEFRSPSNSRSRPGEYSLVDVHNPNRKSDWRHKPRTSGMSTSASKVSDAGAGTPRHHGHAALGVRAAETPTPTKIPGIMRRRDTVLSDEDPGRNKSTRATRTVSPPPPPPNVKFPRMMPPGTQDTEPSRTWAHSRRRVGGASASASSSTSIPHATSSASESATSMSANPSANKLRRNRLQ